MNAKVLDAVKRSAAVPSVPQVVTRFLEVIQDPDFEYAELAKLLSADPGTVSEILRLVNSALFSVARKITSLHQSLTLLGPKRTRSLVLGRYLIEAMGGRSIPGLDGGYFWRRSLATAVLSARFADVVIPRVRDEVFVCALLADVGIPVLTQAFPDQYGPIASRYIPHGRPFTDQEELEAVEATHAEVSAMVLGHWGLPEHICTAVNCHQVATLGGKEPADVYARLINAADRVAKLLCEIPDIEQVADVCTEATQIAGIELEVLARILGEIEGDVEELALILKIDLIPSSVYAMIAKAIQQALAEPAST
ncbi:MAG TPA: HDOD domain-containing protein [Phycisphaerae bacterium]|nr:HDOD domain-containing protein [Phycisphaerae bacterium]